MESIAEREAQALPAGMNQQAPGLQALLHAVELTNLPVAKMRVTQIGIEDATHIARYTSENQAYYTCIHPFKTELESAVCSDGIEKKRIRLEVAQPFSAEHLRYQQRAHIVLAAGSLSAYSARQIIPLFDRAATGTEPGGIFYATLDAERTWAGDAFWLHQGRYNPEAILEAVGPFYELIYEQYQATPAERVTIALRKLGGVAYEYLQEQAPRSYRVV